jgi:hypothetical protein
LASSALHAWGLDLSGLIVGAPDDRALAKALPLSLADHLTWLRCHGENAGDDLSWEVVKEIDGVSFGATGGEFLFEVEKAPVSTADLERLIARLSHARTELMATVEGLPDAILDWEPADDAIGRRDDWAPVGRTIREIFTHALQLEAYYRDGLRDGPSGAIFGPVGDPDAERALTVDGLRALSAADRSRVWVPVRPGRQKPEPWTVRKVVRRVIAHARMHAAEITKRRTWLLLGVPTGST